MLSQEVKAQESRRGGEREKREGISNFQILSSCGHSTFVSCRRFSFFFSSIFLWLFSQFIANKCFVYIFQFSDILRQSHDASHSRERERLCIREEYSNLDASRHRMQSVHQELGNWDMFSTHPNPQFLIFEFFSSSSASSSSLQTQVFFLCYASSQEKRDVEEP